jgi:hypothetical protein
MATTKPQTLGAQIAEVSAELDKLGDLLKDVPIHFRQSTDFRVRVARKHKLTAQLEALRRLEQLSSQK